ncbi:MAG: outer membrane protein assembly factor [Candidatus Infernicultor aquiphilus]|uniref:Outer membrane protein assembly factor n=1 Tax=Candidatus Infernicultor aquiphilus TaxID=1805029 RepID=A0A2M7PLH7_9BACT|nr:MAG: outer membrane protein assembly factor [Candidatus Atribacteria bacterium CG_4_10_14_3_um_filter_34_13]
MPKKKWNYILLTGFLTLIFIWVGLNMVEAENQGKITAIVVEGNENISKDLIISQITSNLGDVFSKESIEKDVKAIYELGYFKDVRVKLESFREGYKVVFVVVENLAVKEINITGNTVVSKEEMREVMILQEGQIFSQKILKNDLTRISQLYKDRGYLLINIKDINFDEEGKLWINISEGRLEKIVIEGNDKTKEKVITREINIKPGDLFDFEKVKKSLQKIYNLGYFEDVTMKLEPGSEEDVVVLVIKVIEKNTGKFGIGAGYNSEEGLMGFASIEEMNLFGGGQKVGAKLELGGRTTYKVSFLEPWLANTPTSLGFDVYDTTTNQEDKEGEEVIAEYDEIKLGGRLIFGRKISDSINLGLELKTERVNYDLISGALPEDTNEGLTNSLMPTFTYDTRDNVFDPTSGWYSSLSIEKAGGFLRGDYNFTKYNLTLRTYLSTDFFKDIFNIGSLKKITDNLSKGVLAFRAMGGMADTDLPSFAEYQVGGMNTIRGYDSGEFSGDKSLVFNAEYRFPLAENFQAVLFVDWGQTWDIEESIDIADLKFGRGVGVRFDTPIGPIRLDYGINEEGIGKTYFSIGHTF